MNTAIPRTKYTVSAHLPRIARQRIGAPGRSTLPCNSLLLAQRAGRGCPIGLGDRRVENAVEPTADRVSDLLPIAGDHVEVRPALELEVVRLRGRRLVALVLSLRERCRDRVIRVR